MPIQISVTVPSFASDFERFIKQELATQFIRYTNTIIPQLEQNIRNIVRSAIETSPEYVSLLSGELQYDFGLANPEYELSQIIDYITNSIRVRTGPAEAGYLGGLIVEILPLDFQALYDIGTYTSISSINGRESEVPWLKWLLTEGTNIVVAEYRILNQPRPSSRSGGAIMIPGGSFSVNAIYAGTEDNNWFTRVFDTIVDEIEGAMYAGT